MANTTYRSINRPPLSVLDPWEPGSPALPLELPDDDESFSVFARFFTTYLIEHVDGPLTLQQIQLLPAAVRLAQALSGKHNPSIIAALLGGRMHFASHTVGEGRHGVNKARALACEVIAVEIVGYLSEHDVVQYLSYEVPGLQKNRDEDSDVEEEQQVNEASQLLSSPGIGYAANANTISSAHGSVSGTSTPNNGLESFEGMEQEEQDSMISMYGGLNALELAIVAEAKYFLSQRSVQRVVDGIWDGRVVFWEGLNVTGHKRPHIYNKRKADPYSRLRVPKYQKFFETLFFAAFTTLYYAVLIERNPNRITPTETVLFFFFVAFGVDEVTQWIDAGTLFYSSDIWSWLDMFVILIGLAFLSCRIIGLVKDDADIVDTSFDILSLEALFLVPRAFSLLSLHPYFGVLIPCLKQMTKDFCKFMVLVGILYCGFLSTFSILGRDKFTMIEMSAIMTRVFFGGTSYGFDSMKLISPILGPPLMLLFIVLTNILLITSLISLLSNSLTQMMNNAREEYLFMYSTFVMGSVTSNRLTYFYPPLNLIPLIFLRPLRLFLSSTQVRRVRIALLKFTHFPLVAAIVAYEGVAKSKSRTNRTAWHASSFRQPATKVAGPLNRKSPENFPGRLPLPSKLSPGGASRSASISGLGPSAAAERENKKLREIIQELSLKVDTLLAKQ